MYESFYGLRAKPFQLSPDPRFFFESKGHRRALAYLRYGVKQGDGFIVITGDVGTGKTTLVSALSRFLSNEHVVTANLVTTQLEAKDLLRMVAAGFGLPYERISKARLLRSLHSYFLSCADEGKRTLLIVDEAQNLPGGAIEELRMLSNLQWRNRPLLQSFLLGQREFRITLRSESFEQLRQRIIAAYHLEPLGATETHDYIKHRLMTAGWQGDPAFDEEIFPEIYAFTAGVPRRINTLCDRLLLFGFLGEDHTLGIAHLAEVGRDLISEGSGPAGGLGRLSDETEHNPTQNAASALPSAITQFPAAERPSAKTSKDADGVEHLETAVKAMQIELARLREALEKRKKNGQDESG